ncbi:putative zinc-binding metallopeptidase [Caballeronia sp.]|jgi:hypothetical protein|uniref:zinc-binding metallopeptidase family protein n=1 Tax=Caballeronia sp. TaxID=1931223 RepID=UPI00262B230D|nr:putative zinc-binding metallopeptidase [Caballeronia sp.]
MKTFHCNHCNQLVFFENFRCERCESLLGFIPEIAEISAFEDAGDGLWRSRHPEHRDTLYKRCHNYEVEKVCNWMVPAESTDPLCHACRLTHTIPNLGVANRRYYWFRLEAAKRRLLYTLGALGLRVESRQDNPKTGLQFKFLEDKRGKRVLTGHDRGLITMNIAEADDAQRERVRLAMGEPYRTLLGHFRHEIGHYYFDRLVANTPWITGFRKLFGDERANYREALAKHYKDGAPPHWGKSFVSAYATTHPWEDWAETWAHYLHIVDTVDTAMACGVALMPGNSLDPTLAVEVPPGEATFDHLMKQWFPLTYALNSLNRSLGMPDAYPFALAPPVVEKLRFVDRVIAAAGHAQPLPEVVIEAVVKPVKPSATRANKHA